MKKIKTKLFQFSTEVYNKIEIIKSKREQADWFYLIAFMLFCIASFALVVTAVIKPEHILAYSIGFCFCSFFAIIIYYSYDLLGFIHKIPAVK